MMRSGLSEASNSSSAHVIGAAPDRGVRMSRARPTMRMFPPRPSGHEISMLDVRRRDPGTRRGTGPAEHLGGGERASVTSEDYYQSGLCWSAELRSLIIASRWAGVMT